MSDDDISELVDWQMQQKPTATRYGCVCGTTWTGDCHDCPECGAEAVIGSTPQTSPAALSCDVNELAGNYANSYAVETAAGDPIGYVVVAKRSNSDGTISHEPVRARSGPGASRIVFSNPALAESVRDVCESEANAGCTCVGHTHCGEFKPDPVEYFVAELRAVADV